MKVFPPVSPKAVPDNLPPPQARTEAVKSSVFAALSAAAPSGAHSVGAPPPVSAPTPTQPMTTAQENTYYFTWATENLSMMYYYATKGDTADYNNCLTILQDMSNASSKCPDGNLSAFLKDLSNSANFAANATGMANFAALWTSGSNLCPPSGKTFFNLTGDDPASVGLSQCLADFMALSPSGNTSYAFTQLQPTEVLYMNIFMLAVSLNPASGAAKSYNMNSTIWNPYAPSPFPADFSRSIVTCLWQLYCTNPNGSAPTAAQLTAFHTQLSHINDLVNAVNAALGGAVSTNNFNTYVVQDSDFGKGWATIYSKFESTSFWPHGVWTGATVPQSPFYYDGTNSYSLPTDQNPTGGYIPSSGSTYYQEAQDAYLSYGPIQDWDEFFTPS